MINYRKQMVRSIDNRLGGLTKQQGSMYGVPVDLRPHCQQHILDVAGGRMDIADNLPIIILADGSVIADDNEHDFAWKTIETALDHWMNHGTAPIELSRALPLASGAERIADKLGVDIERMCALAYNIHTANVLIGDAIFTVQKSGTHFHAIYKKGWMRWENGIITVSSKPLPGLIRSALKGRKLSALIDDAVIGDAIITHVVDADSRQHLLRVHTQDARKFI